MTKKHQDHECKAGATDAPKDVLLDNARRCALLPREIRFEVARDHQGSVDLSDWALDWVERGKVDGTTLAAWDNCALTLARAYGVAAFPVLMQYGGGGKVRWPSGVSVPRGEASGEATLKVSIAPGRPVFSPPSGVADWGAIFTAYGPHPEAEQQAALVVQKHAPRAQAHIESTPGLLQVCMERVPLEAIKPIRDEVLAITSRLGLVFEYIAQPLPGSTVDHTKTDGLVLEAGRHYGRYSPDRSGGTYTARAVKWDENKP